MQEQLCNCLLWVQFISNMHTTCRKGNIWRWMFCTEKFSIVVLNKIPFFNKYVHYLQKVKNVTQGSNSESSLQNIFCIVVFECFLSKLYMLIAERKKCEVSVLFFMSYTSFWNEWDSSFSFSSQKSLCIEVS